MTARFSGVNDSNKEICRREKKNPRLRAHKRKKPRLRQGCKCVERPRNTVCIGIFEVYTSVPADRDGYTVEVHMHDAGIIMFVIRVFPLIRRQVHVLVWRH